MRRICARRARHLLRRGGSGCACCCCLHDDQQSRVCGIHPALPAQSLADVPLGAGPALAPELFLQQAFHEPGSFLAGAFAWSARPAAAWIACAGAFRHGRRSFLAWLCSCGLRASTSSTPARDVEFDRSVKLHQHLYSARRASRAMGRRPLLMRSAIVPLLGPGLIYPLGWVYFTGVTAVAALLVYEHADPPGRPDERERRVLQRKRGDQRGAPCWCRWSIWWFDADRLSVILRRERHPALLMRWTSRGIAPRARPDDRLTHVQETQCPGPADDSFNRD